MKKIFCNIIFILSFFLPVYGQEDASFLNVGYCDGADGKTGEIASANAKKGNAALLLTPEMTKLLSGNRVEGIRLYLPSRTNINSLTAWIRTSLDSGNVTEVNVKSNALKKGWNEFELETPYVIQEGESFFIGFTFAQKSKAYAISCTGIYRDGGLFYKFDDDEWLSDHSYGNLCMEAVVRGDNLPRFDMSLDEAYMEPIYYIGDDP